MANRADPDKAPQKAASDHGLHCLLKLQEVKVWRKRTSPFRTIFPAYNQDSRPDSAVSALIRHLKRVADIKQTSNAGLSV